MNNIRRNLNGPYPRGVPNPYTTHVHPYPTRFHGSLYTRPVFGLPYQKAPYNVLKPNDFVSYYGVSGLSGSSLGTSSLGNGSIGGNTLGLGATGTPIYYLASSTNSKVTTLQGAMNKVLVAERFREIPVTGKVDATFCAALSICMANFRSDLESQAPPELIAEAMRTCELAIQNSTVKRQVMSIIEQMKANRNPVPPEPLVSPTEVVPPTTAPVYVPPPAPAPVPADVPPTPALNPPLIEVPSVPVPAPQPPIVMDFPEMEIEEKPPERAFGKMGLAAVLAVAGVGYYIWKRKR